MRDRHTGCYRLLIDCERVSFITQRQFVLISQKCTELHLRYPDPTQASLPLSVLDLTNKILKTSKESTCLIGVAHGMQFLFDLLVILHELVYRRHHN